MAFDVSKLTLGEIAKVEELAGFGIGLIEDAATPKGRLFIALAYVIEKRRDPSYTLARAEQLTLVDAERIVSGGEDVLADAVQTPFPTQPASVSEQSSPNNWPNSSSI
jgi:hypothetical protein